MPSERGMASCCRQHAYADTYTCTYGFPNAYADGLPNTYADGLPNTYADWYTGGKRPDGHTDTYADPHAHAHTHPYAHASVDRGQRHLRR